MRTDRQTYSKIVLALENSVDPEERRLPPDNQCSACVNSSDVIAELVAWWSSVPPSNQHEQQPSTSS